MRHLSHIYQREGVLVNLLVHYWGGWMDSSGSYVFAMTSPSFRISDDDRLLTTCWVQFPKRVYSRLSVKKNYFFSSFLFHSIFLLNLREWNSILYSKGENLDFSRRMWCVQYRQYEYNMVCSHIFHNIDTCRVDFVCKRGSTVCRAFEKKKFNLEKEFWKKMLEKKFGTRI